MKKTNNKSNTEVSQFLENLNHPKLQVIHALREIIYTAAPGIEEHIKWNAPSFVYRGTDRITFNFQGKDKIRLVFHCGAKSNPKRLSGPLISDDSGLLQWAAHDRAIATISDHDDMLAKKKSLIRVIEKWLEMPVE